MQNQSGHKKTGLTELAALLTIGFSIYQGQKLGVINPELIGHLVIASWELAVIVGGSTFVVGRSIWKKFFRPNKPRSTDGGGK